MRKATRRSGTGSELAVVWGTGKHQTRWAKFKAMNVVTNSLNHWESTVEYMDHQRKGDRCFSPLFFAFLLPVYGIRQIT